MKKIDKNIYKEAQYGKKSLMTIAIILGVLSLGALGGGIAMIVVGATSGVLAKIIWMSIVGAVLVILGIIFTIVAIYMLAVSTSMINNKEGSVKDGNRAKGTVNVVKCDKCGTELPDNATFCSKCGTAVSGVKICACGATNTAEAEYCISCGKKF